MSALETAVCADADHNEVLATEAFGTFCKEDILKMLDEKTVSQIKIEDFECGMLLGEGGFGKVYLARHKASNFIVGLKCLKRDQYKETYLRVRLNCEIILQHEVRHENVLKTHNVFGSKEFIYIIMEYAAGGTLREILKCKGALSEELAARYISDLSKALHHCHLKEIIHRDIKPDNLLLGIDGRIKIADFGTAARLFYPRGTVGIGTMGYIAPEAAVMGFEHNEKRDVWSLGMCLFEFLVGRLPTLRNDYTVKWPSNLSKDAKDLVSSMLQLDPQNRICPQEIPNHPFVLRALGTHI